MKLRKILSFALIISFMLAFTAACQSTDPGSTTNTPSPTSTPAGSGGTAATPVPVAEREHVTLRMYFRDTDTIWSSLDDEVGQKIYEDLKTEVEFLPFGESMWEKAAMMLAAQDWGDLDMVNTDMLEVTQMYIEAGALVRLDDYRDQLSNFYSYYTDVIPYLRSLDSENGDLYVWSAGPDQMGLFQPPLDICTRIDVMEALGWPDLDTTDDYIDFLRKAIEMFPETNGQRSIGMSGLWGLAPDVGSVFATYLVRHSGFQHYYEVTGMVDPETGRFIDLIPHEYNKEAMRFYNTLYREGLLDREIWTDGIPELQDKMNSGVAITANFMNWGVGEANREARERGQPEMQYLVTPIRLSIAKEEGRNVRYELYNALRMDEMHGILTSSPNIDRAIELVNYLATYEMTVKAGWGTEGVDFTIENGLMRYTDEFLEISREGGRDFSWSKGFHGVWDLFPTRRYSLLPNGQAARGGADPSTRVRTADEVALYAFENMGWSHSVSGWWDNPHFDFVPFDISDYIVASTLDTESELNHLKTRIAQHIYEQLPRAINASTEAEFERIYDALVNDVKSMGIQDILDHYNEAMGELHARMDELRAR